MHHAGDKYTEICWKTTMQKAICPKITFLPFFSKNFRMTIKPFKIGAKIIFISRKINLKNANSTWCIIFAIQYNYCSLMKPTFRTIYALLRTVKIMSWSPKKIWWVFIQSQWYIQENWLKIWPMVPEILCTHLTSVMPILMMMGSIPKVIFPLNACLLSL